MITVENVLEYLFTIAPVEAKMDFDNVGLLVGRKDARVNRALVSLDITNDVITEALDIGAELIVSHHPLFFSLKSITDDDTIGQKLIRIISGGISAICMHTNLDAAKGGTSDALAIAAGIANGSAFAELLDDEGKLQNGTPYSYGRAGCIQNPLSLEKYLELLKKALKTDGLRYYDAGKEVYKVAVVSGSGGDYLLASKKRGCDTLVTADIKYDVFLEAMELGMNLIDGGHYTTENLVTGTLVEKLCIEFPQVATRASTNHSQIVRHFT